MKLSDTCRHYAPYRSSETHRPRPTQRGVCEFPVVWQTLPNAYDATPRVARPITPAECKGCPFYAKRETVWHEPLRQKEMEV